MMCELLLRTYIVFLSLIISTALNATVINGSNVLDVYGREARLYGYDSSTISAYAGSDIAWLYSYDNSEINIYAGSDVSWMYGYDNSTINVYAGSTVSRLYGYFATNINISGGEISWLILNNQSVSNITGVDALSWLLVNDSSEVNIFGSEFRYTKGNLSGLWENGLPFSFWALEESDLFSGNISSVLPDNIRLRSVSVPEPGTIFLFLIGLVVASYNSKFKYTNLSRGSSK